jgi:LemA protein
MKLALIWIAALFGVGLVVTCFVFSSKNTAISLEENVNTAKSGIEVQLANRFNKLTEIAECVKQYDTHEYKTLVDVINARGKNMSSQEFKDTMFSINAVAEQYPVLQSQKNYQQLMTEIALTENHLAQHKKAYNESVRDYRFHCRKFPTSIFLGWTGYEVQAYDMYAADESVKDTKPMKLF